MDARHPFPAMQFNILDYYMKLAVDRVVLYYKGPFDEEILARFTHYIRKEFQSDFKLTNQVLSVFMELAQNIARYSEEHNFYAGEETPGVGTIVIIKADHRISLVAGNAVRTEVVNELSSKCREINELNHDELRALRREVRNKPREEDQAGGNIGLIQVALKSNSPLRIEHKPIDEHLSFYLLSVDILLPDEVYQKL
jgi:hypothetical protein